MADWATISQVATAAGTLVLAAATFSPIRDERSELLRIWVLDGVDPRNAE